MSGKASDFIPAIKYGNKIYPQDLAGMIGLPSIGNVSYVDGGSGSDTANSGTTATDAFKTVSHALDMATANQHDVIVIVSHASAVSEGAAINWNKNYTHLIGMASPIGLAGRARITDGGTGTTGASPFFTVSASGCIFVNVQIGTFSAGSLINTLVSGQRNYFGTMHFAGIGNDTAGDSSAARSLKVTGSENVFDDSIIGLDTIARSTTNAEIEVSGGATRNRFRNCMVNSYADNSGHFFVNVGSIDRFVLFEGCYFYNAISSAATTMTDAITIGASPGGMVIMKDCYKIGATGWGDNLTNIYALGISSNATFANGIGFGVNPGA